MGDEKLIKSKTLAIVQFEDGTSIVETKKMKFIDDTILVPWKKKNLPAEVIAIGDDHEAMKSSLSKFEADGGDDIPFVIDELELGRREKKRKRDDAFEEDYDETSVKMKKITMSRSSAAVKATVTARLKKKLGGTDAHCSTDDLLEEGRRLTKVLKNAVTRELPDYISRLETALGMNSSRATLVSHTSASPRKALLQGKRSTTPRKKSCNVTPEKRRPSPRKAKCRLVTPDKLHVKPQASTQKGSQFPLRDGQKGHQSPLENFDCDVLPLTDCRTDHSTGEKSPISTDIFPTGLPENCPTLEKFGTEQAKDDDSDTDILEEETAQVLNSSRADSDQSRPVPILKRQDAMIMTSFNKESIQKKSMSPKETSHKNHPQVIKSPNAIKTVYGLRIEDDGCVHIFGYKIQSQKLLLVPTKNPAKTVYALASVLMTQEEMTHYSLTGKQSNVFKGQKDAKPELPEKMKATITHLAKQIHPSLSEKDINRSIATKLNMACKYKKKTDQN